VRWFFIVGDLTAGSSAGTDALPGRAASNSAGTAPVVVICGTGVRGFSGPGSIWSIGGPFNVSLLFVGLAPGTGSKKISLSTDDFRAFGLNNGLYTGSGGICAGPDDGTDFWAPIPVAKDWYAGFAFAAEAIAAGLGPFDA
jgi:hypothetical protein